MFIMSRLIKRNYLIKTLKGTHMNTEIIFYTFLRYTL
jgi:hypothetical protein